MAADQTSERPGFSDLLQDLSDRDVILEVTLVAGASQVPEAGRVQSLRDAIEESYRALAGSAPVQLETVAVIEEVAKRSLSLWLRAKTGGEGDPEAWLLKFLSSGPPAAIAWIDGSPTLQLAELQQAFRVLAGITSIT